MGAHTPIHILFDAQSMTGNKTGIGTYTYRLIASLAATYPNEVRLTGFYSATRPVAELPQAANIRYKRLPLSRKILNELRRRHLLPPIELLSGTRADFLLFPDFLDIPSAFKTPRAVAIHDMTYHDHPEYVATKNARDLTRFVPEVLRRSSFVITVSHFSAQRIHDSYNIPLSDILVTPVPPLNATPLQPRTAETLREKHGIADKPYILFIGTLEPRKNLVTLMDAYSNLPKEQRDQYALVIAGKIDWKSDTTTSKLSELQQQGCDIRSIGYVDDETRSALYQEASLFVMPSTYEGFGMPILEALQFNTPCLVSDIPPFHELGGNAVQYFDPHKVSDLTRTLATALATGRPKVPSKLPPLKTWEQISAELYERIVQSVTKS